jgi:hypothetical protein
MDRRPPLLILVPLTYVVGVLVCRVLLFGRFALDGPTLAGMVAVPLAQAGALAVWRRMSLRRRPR